MKDSKLTKSIVILIIVVLLGGLLGYGYLKKATYKLQRPVVSMEIEGYGTVKIELYPDEAPNTVKNFIKLINDGHYNGTIFHRVEENLIQGGQTQANDTEEVGRQIVGEFSKNGYDNGLKFERGTVGLARKDYSDNEDYIAIDPGVVKMGYNTGYDQFFIMTEDCAPYDGYYCAFGKVIEGIEIVDNITKIETTIEADEETGVVQTSKPVNPPVISSITVETFGVDYSDPETEEEVDIDRYILKKFYESYGITVE